MTKENGVAGDMRQFETEMQTLVYDNYNKFISATETIRKMKSQVEHMESDMKRLEENMQNISGLSVTIDHALAPKRDEIFRLSRIYSSSRNCRRVSVSA